MTTRNKCTVFENTRQDVIEDFAFSERFPTRREAEAELVKAIAECLRPCCEGTVRHTRIQIYLNWAAIVNALDVLEGINGRG